MRVRFIRDVDFASEHVRVGTIAAAIEDADGLHVELDDGSLAMVSLGEDVVIDCPCGCHTGSGMMHFVACC